MVERYPHTFTLKLLGALVKDAQGNTSNSTTIIELTVKGRAKVAGLGQNTILAENGDVTPFSHTITFPLFDENFDNGMVIWQGKTYSIIRFRKYQNRCKVWV